MKNSWILILSFLMILSISCQKNKVETKVETTIAIDSTQNQQIIRSIGETLTPAAKKKVENWAEYQELDQLLSSFYSSSHNEVLNLSKELTNTTKRLKDSIPIDRYKQADIGIRINVIYNTALRLKDMSTIQNVSVNEVNSETQNMLDAFSALNSKINNLTIQENLEAELRTFN